MSDDRRLRRVARDYVRPLLPQLLLAEVCMAAVALATAAQAQLVQPVVDRVFVEARADLLWPLALAVVAVFVLKGLAALGQAALLSGASYRLLGSLQRDLFARLVRADPASYARTGPGELLARFTHDANQLRAVTVRVITGIGRHALTLVALVAVMVYQDPLLAFVALVVCPLALWPIARIGRRLRTTTRRASEAVGELTAHVDEALQAVRVVQAHGMEDRETARAGERVDRVARRLYRGDVVANLRHPVVEMVGGIAVAAVLAYGGAQTIAGTRSSGSLFAFLTALLLAYEPLKRLARLHGDLHTADVAAERVFAAMDVAPGVTEAPDAVPLQVTGGALRLRGVTFAYPDSTTPAVNGLDLEVPAGKTVALVGANGSGKSTALDLVARLRDPDAGRVEIDGQDLAGVTLASLRRAVALVTQEVLLFDDTLRANIVYGRPNADDAAVAHAVEAAGLEALTASLPEGLETRLGPRGGRLSGGERQRVAIARAVLCDAPVLLLDEATAALDANAERSIGAALERLWARAGRTTLVVAHRLQAVASADLVYVLDGGRLVESGTHAELVARGGRYADLHGALAS